MAFTGYPSKGIYPSAHSNIIPAITEISRGAGVPGINMYCKQPGGVGKHKTGEACDFQGGGRTTQAIQIHTAIANYALANWTRLRVRYIAWNGYEWVNSPSRRRRQVKNYGGTDPFHQRHVHVDFNPGPIPGAVPGIAVGGGLIQATGGSRYYTGRIDGSPGPYTYTALQRFLADRDYYNRAIDGQAGTYTWTAYQKFLIYMGYYSGTPLGFADKTSARGTQNWMDRSGYYNDRITAVWDRATWRALQTYLSYAHAGTKLYPKSESKPVNTDRPATTAPTTKKDGVLMSLTNKQQAQVHTQIMNISAATNRSEQREREMLTALEQQNLLLQQILTELTNGA